MSNNAVFYFNAAWVTAGSIFSSVLFLWLALLSGKGYSVEDTEAHASSYGDIIKEGHGPIGIFLWVFFILVFAWTIFYFVSNAPEFDVIFAGF